MKRFVVPPTWPSPPRRSWVPPKTWRPDPSWPPAPEDWKFWVDGKGNPVRGPIGRYAGPSRKAMYVGAGAVVVFLGVNIWAATALGLFSGDSGDQAVHVVDDSRSVPSATPTVTPPRVSTPPPVATTTAPKPTVVPTPTGHPTQRPTKKPTKSRTTDSRTEERPDPTPTKTTTTTKTPRPRPTATQTPPTQEEILRQYCLQRGWDPEWCDPDNWDNNPADDPRNGG
ncbi:hypothetical protein AB0L70_22520 [Kribbella sp. NPDC051952]|uniref:hypothetical protein n=1 Tax=Kribbella sp. NPDC051952 TaxID=3154851 RepID=UPI003421B675